MVFAALPFAFGVIRAIETRGRDIRYILVALAAFGGGAAVFAAARRYTTGRKVAAALFVAVLMGATLLAVVAAMLLGTTLGPGILVVASAFGFCLAAASVLRHLAVD
jgi:hypothetical protein